MVTKLTMFQHTTSEKELLLLDYFMLLLMPKSVLDFGVASPLADDSNSFRVSSS